MGDADLFHQVRRAARARHLSLLVAAGTLVLAGRLFALQVLGVEEYSLQSERNRIRREWVSAPRGLIEDRSGIVLADSRPSFTVLAVPTQLLQREHSLLLLAELLDMPEAKVRERLTNVPSQIPRVVRRDVGFAEVSRIAEREEELPGVSMEVSNVRSYPQGAMGAHLLGHVGEISEDEVERLRDDGYRSGMFLGRTGLERQYESALRGRDGERYLEVDAMGRVVGRFTARDPVPPVTGSTLHLHLDARLQAVAESLLVGRRGSICVMDANTGGVLVLASAPTFDPNLFATGIAAEDWNPLNTDPRKPLLNRALQAQYAPGSTFKGVSFVTALEKRMVSYRELCPIPCKGGYPFGNRWFGCWEELGHGQVDLEQALVQSCDVYFYQIAERLSADDLAKQARASGLGVPTGIDLPHELSGNIPDVAWLNKRYGERKWTRGNLLNLVIGQGEYLVTPLQMARYAATVGNGGKVLRPRIVQSIEDAEGNLTRFPPKVEQVWEMSALTRSRLEEAHRLVVQDPEVGTGRGSRIDGFEVAGKTGTAENAHGKPHSWFIAYGPAGDPEIALSVIMEGAGHGSDAAVPAAKKLLRAYLGREGTT